MADRDSLSADVLRQLADAADELARLDSVDEQQSRAFFLFSQILKRKSRESAAAPAQGRERKYPDGDYAPALYYFYRKGQRVHIHSDRTVFETWMEDAPDRYPPSECEIIKYVPEDQPSRRETGEGRAGDGATVAGADRDHWRAKAEAAESKLARAKEALEKWGAHAEYCRQDSPHGQCTCGLESLIASLSTPSAEGERG